MTLPIINCTVTVRNPDGSDYIASPVDGNIQNLSGKQVANIFAGFPPDLNFSQWVTIKFDMPVGASDTPKRLSVITIVSHETLPHLVGKQFITQRESHVSQNFGTVYNYCAPYIRTGQQT